VPKTELQVWEIYPFLACPSQRDVCAGYI